MSSQVTSAGMDPSTCWCSSTFGKSRMRVSSSRSASADDIALTSERRAYNAGRRSAQDGGGHLDLEAAVAGGIGGVRHDEGTAVVEEHPELLAHGAVDLSVGSVGDVVFESQDQADVAVLDGRSGVEVEHGRAA